MSDWKDKTKPHWVNPQRDRIATLERELARHREQLKASEQRRCAREEAAEARLAERERELAEAREQRDSNDRACQAALAGNTLATQRARAAEARLAAVASEMREHVSRRHGISVWRSMVGKWAAALTAPAEPHPGAGGGDDEGYIDPDVARGLGCP